MEFGKRHDTTDTVNGLSPAPTCYGLVVYVADFLRESCQLITDFLRGNHCNGFWP